MIKKITVMILVVCTLLLSALGVYALYYPNSFYDSISWTWEYSDTYTSSYNCLGYATGSMTWEWPWGSSNPTSSQVNSYLGSKGYSTSGSWAYMCDKKSHNILPKGYPIHSG